MCKLSFSRTRNYKKILPLIVVLGALVLLSSCAGEEVKSEEVKPDKETVKVVYVSWESEIASAHVVKAVIEEKLGYDCELLNVTAISMWESVAAGDQDAMVAAWLPSLHEQYYEELAEDLKLVGPNLEGVEMGLAVPEYVDLDSIEELNEHADKFDESIIGIDPEAGLMGNTEKAIEKYGLNQFELVSGSDATMTSALDIAYEEERWIVVTGWSPHWKFARWDLKYLDDPKNVYGEEEYIGTVVRKGLEDDMPEVYSFFENFYWEPADMEQVMLWFAEEGMAPEEAAERWVTENEEVVKQWVGE